MRQLIRLDQLVATRLSVRLAIQINIVVSFLLLLVTIHYRHGFSGKLWFAAAALINVVRLLQCGVPSAAQIASYEAWQVERLFRGFTATALISGIVWAFVSVLCQFYTAPETLFCLVVVCGITAGAVVHGVAYAPIPICFITPPLLSIFACLLYAGGFEHYLLAGAVLVYTCALIRVTRENEAGFRETSRLKNEAVIMTKSLHEAHSRAIEVANEMAYRATHDGMTGLLNRAGFIQLVENRLADKKTAFCLMLLDLDGFKSINDVFGHQTGDRVLVEVARRLREALTEDYAIARMGGDEFAVFYDNSVMDEIPAEIATRLVTAIEVPFASFDAGRLGACVGVYSGRGCSVTEMLTCADEALYVAKSAGRNRYYVFDEILRERSEMRHDAERDLQHALNENEIELWYQPIFNRRSGSMISLEALLRWKHKRHGWIPPEEIVMVAARSGLAEALLRYSFGEVCAMIGKLADLGLHDVRVALNISPREISRLPIDAMLLKGLAASGVPAVMLEIEITEESAMDIRSVQEKLNRLAKSGVGIAVDDFGVGYSSLATLRQPYITKIKIDNSFVRGITRSSENQILVQAVLNLGRSMNVQVVAEGVESREDLDWLEQNGADLLQGYFLLPPGRRETIIQWLRQQGVALH